MGTCFDRCCCVLRQRRICSPPMLMSLTGWEELVAIDPLFGDQHAKCFF